MLGDLTLKDVPGLYVLVWSGVEAKEIRTIFSPVKDTPNTQTAMIRHYQERMLYGLVVSAA